jgi:hypothetical protein
MYNVIGKYVKMSNTLDLEVFLTACEDQGVTWTTGISARDFSVPVFDVDCMYYVSPSKTIWWTGLECRINKDGTINMFGESYEEFKIV